MTLQQAIDLKEGDIVVHRPTGISYRVTFNARWLKFIAYLKTQVNKI